MLDATAHGGKIIQGETSVLIGNSSSAPGLMAAAASGKPLAKKGGGAKKPKPAAKGSKSGAPAPKGSSAETKAPPSGESTPSGGSSSSKKDSNDSPTKTKEEEKKSELCGNKTLTVQCKHGEGTYVLNVPGDKDSVQVIAGPEKKGHEITAKTKITKGPCPSHKGKVFEISDGDFKSKSDTECKFDVFCSSQYKFDYFRNIWPYPASTQTYNVTATTCDTEDESSATVEVFPDIKWEASVSIGSTHEINKTKSSTELNSSKKDTFAVTGMIKVNIDGEDYDLSVNFQDYMEQALKILNTSKQMINYVSSALQHVGGVKLTILYPKFVIKGTWGYEEIKGGLVDFGYALTLGLDPIIGIEGSVDILDPLCGLIPTLGPIVQRIKRAAEKGVGGSKATIAILITATGQIGGNLTVKRMAGNKSVSASGQVTGLVGIKIQGIVSGTLDLFLIKVGAGAEVGADSSITGTISCAGDQRGPYTQGKITWNGLKVYALVYVSADLNTKPYKEKKKKAGKYSKTDSAGNADGTKANKGISYELISPKTWPFNKNYFLE